MHRLVGIGKAGIVSVTWLEETGPLVGGVTDGCLRMDFLRAGSFCCSAMSSAAVVASGDPSSRSLAASTAVA